MKCEVDCFTKISEIVGPDPSFMAEMLTRTRHGSQVKIWKDMIGMGEKHNHDLVRDICLFLENNGIGCQWIPTFGIFILMGHLHVPIKNFAVEGRIAGGSVLQYAAVFNQGSTQKDFAAAYISIKSLSEEESKISQRKSKSKRKDNWPKLRTLLSLDVVREDIIHEKNLSLLRPSVYFTHLYNESKRDSGGFPALTVKNFKRKLDAAKRSEGIPRNELKKLDKLTTKISDKELVQDLSGGSLDRASAAINKWRTWRSRLKKLHS